MDAVQKDHWYYVVLLIFLSLLRVAVQQREAAVSVRLEEGMLLGCLCPWDGNLSMVSWTKAPGKSPLAVFHPEYGVAFSHHYRERIEFLRTTPMDGSITMRNVTHQDIGLYHCSVQTFPQGSWTRDIQVEDSDEAPADETTETPAPEVIENPAPEVIENPAPEVIETPAPEVIETPAPEVIEADADVVMEPNNDLTIDCHHEHNGTVYQVIVENMARGRPWSVVGVCRVVGGDYAERGGVSCADSLNADLQLTELVEEDGGFYRCRFSIDAGEFSLSVYMMCVYTGAGVAGLVLLIVIVVLAVRHRKRNRRVEYRVKLHPSPRPKWRQWHRE